MLVQKRLKLTNIVCLDNIWSTLNWKLPAVSHVWSYLVHCFNLVSGDLSKKILLTTSIVCEPSAAIGKTADANGWEIWLEVHHTGCVPNWYRAGLICPLTALPDTPERKWETLMRRSIRIWGIWTESVNFKISFLAGAYQTHVVVLEHGAIKRKKYTYIAFVSKRLT